MSFDAFLSSISLFSLGCGSVLIISAWPERILRPVPDETLVLLLGAALVLLAGYALAMALTV